MGNISQDVLEKAISGDKQAFECIYKEYSRFVYYVSLRIVDLQQEAQEVTQEVFLKVYRKLDQFESQSSLKTWIYRITINTALNYRRQHKYEAKEVCLDEAMPFAAQEKTDTKVLDQERDIMIKQSLAYLDDDQRVCLVLRVQENLSYEEIADVLNININTVRSRLKRARLAMIAMRKEVMDHEM